MKIKTINFLIESQRIANSIHTIVNKWWNIFIHPSNRHHKKQDKRKIYHSYWLDSRLWNLYANCKEWKKKYACQMKRKTFTPKLNDYVFCVQKHFTSDLFEINRRSITSVLSDTINFHKLFITVECGESRLRLLDTINR